jgi:hypothetical protein
MMDPQDPCISPWRTSTYSGGGNQCVEVAVLPSGKVAVRDTKDHESASHEFSAAAWTAFVVGLKHRT